jgi:hypothetical protein
MAETHAENAHKMSAFTGWYFGIERITQACLRNFGGGNPMPSWACGWAAANPRDPNAPNPPGGPLLQTYPPDVTMVELGEREEGFQGGIGRYVAWPEIHKMRFDFRNPVSGRIPGSTVTDKSINYWPLGCVPCEAEPAWQFTNNGYQQTPTGPTFVTVTSDATDRGTAATATVTVTAGPDEPVNGTLVLKEAPSCAFRAARDAVPGRTDVGRPASDLRPQRTVHDLTDAVRRNGHLNRWPLPCSATMSSSNTPQRSTGQRVTIALVVGILAFAIVKIATDSNLQLPAGVGAGILAWLITAPEEKKEEQKKKK